MRFLPACVSSRLFAKLTLPREQCTIDFIFGGSIELPRAPAISTWPVESRVSTIDYGRRSQSPCNPRIRSGWFDGGALFRARQPVAAAHRRTDPGGTAHYNY